MTSPAHDLTAAWLLVAGLMFLSLALLLRYRMAVREATEAYLLDELCQPALGMPQPEVSSQSALQSFDGVVTVRRIHEPESVSGQTPTLRGSEAKGAQTL